MIQRWHLSNGAQLVIEEIPHLHSAAIGVYVRVGSRFENDRLAGASHFVEHMLFKGTESRSARDIAESFETMGGQLNAFTSREHTCVYARVLDEDVDQALEVIADMLFSSQFADKDFNTEREVVLEEISMYEDTPDDLVHDVFTSAMWYGQAMGIPILGSRESLEGMSRQQLYDYYRRHYHPSRMIIALAGNIDPERMRERLEQLCDGQGVAPSIAEPERAETAGPFLQLVEKETEQVQICVGLPGISWHDSDRYAQNLVNNVLGGGMSSRLFQRLREEMGLAYSVYSYAHSYSDTGLFGIYAGTGPNKLSPFFDGLQDELWRLEREGISAAELSRSKKLAKSSVYLGLESVMNRMTRIARSTLMYDQVVTAEEVMSRTEAVSLEQTQSFVQRVLGQQALSLAAIGPAAVMDELREEFNARWRQ